MSTSDSEASSTKAAVRQIGSQAFIVMAGTIFTFLVGFPFQIYIANILGTSGLGIFGITEALVTAAAGLLSFGLAPLALRFIPEYLVLGRSKEIRRLVTFGFLILMFGGAIGIICLPLLLNFAPDFARLPAEASLLLPVLALLLPISMVSFFLAQALRGFQEIRVMVFSTSFLALALKVVFTFGLFTAFGASVFQYAWAVIISQALAILPMAWTLRRLIKALPGETQPGSVEIWKWASFAGTNYASGILNMLAGTLDRLIVGALLGSSAVGVLMVVRQIQIFPTIFHQVILTVVSPLFAKFNADSNRQELSHHLHLSNDWIMRLAMPMILTIAIIPEQILRLYGTEFSNQGAGLMTLMALAVAINLASGPVGILINMTGYHLSLLGVTIVSTITVFCGYFFLIPVFGILGAGISTLIGSTLTSILGVWLLWRHIRLSWYDARFRSWLLPSAAVTVFLFIMRPMLEGIEGHEVRAVFLAGLLASTYVIFLFTNLAIGFHEDDRHLMRAVQLRIDRALERSGPLR